jgi:hypothetical protein
LKFSLKSGGDGLGGNDAICTLSSRQRGFTARAPTNFNENQSFKSNTFLGGVLRALHYQGRERARCNRKLACGKLMTHQETLASVFRHAARKKSQ